MGALLLSRRLSLPAPVLVGAVPLLLLLWLPCAARHCTSRAAIFAWASGWSGVQACSATFRASTACMRPSVIMTVLARLSLLVRGAFNYLHAGRSCARRAQPATTGKTLPACTQQPLWCSIWPSHNTCMRNNSNSPPAGQDCLHAPRECRVINANATPDQKLPDCTDNTCGAWLVNMDNLCPPAASCMSQPSISTGDPRLLS